MIEDPSRVKPQEYDPFVERLTMPYATTNTETLMHLLKASLGTGLLSMPIAFMYSGLVLGFVATFFTALICGHCAYVLVQCAHHIYYKEQRSKITYAELVEKTFQYGPESLQRCAGFIKFIVIFGLFLTYFGTLCVYTVLIAKNLQQVGEHWTGQKYDDRPLIAALFVPCLLLVFIPNLKLLAPVSMVANFFMVCAVFGSCYYSVRDSLPPAETRAYYVLSTMPSYFAIAIFAMQCIGMILPLENSMKAPKEFLGVFGVLAQGMLGIAIFCATLGLLGYWKYGPDTEETITLNLPVEELPAQLVLLMVALATYGTFGLQFTVCLEIGWYYLEDSFSTRPRLGDYIVRTTLTLAAVAVAVGVPSIAPFMGLIGAFCFSILGLVMPVILELIMGFEYGFGAFNCIIWKNIFIICFGAFALVLGSSAAIKEISKLYD